MKLFVFGSSLTSSYWNGAATYYRGIYKALHALGHSIRFAEPDIYQRQRHRDGDEIDYADILVYQTPRDLEQMLTEAASADLVVKHSGVGADDEFLERSVLRLRTADTRVAFWDVDAPATLRRVQTNSDDPFRELIEQYDFIFTYGGGPPVVESYRRLGARNCYPIYNALDADTHYPVAADQELACDLAFVAHRLPDREARVEEFFVRAAKLAPEFSFLLGGEGWAGKPLPSNVRWIGHVGTGNHNGVNCSARIVLNVNRESMAETGYSPPTRVFEAAGAGKCVITDRWPGVEEFFEPDEEILVATSAADVVRFLRQVTPTEAQQIGSAMRARALREHTYAQRAAQVQSILEKAGVVQQQAVEAMPAA
jgi:spore maturation protein CgeB